MKKRRSETSRDNYLPPELIRQVLARLPAKTLIKFRSVSKSWLSLIDSPDFISLHFNFHNNTMNYNNNNNNNPQLLAWEKRKQVGFIFTLRTADTFKMIHNLGRIPTSHNLLSYGCCNGLMLINSYGNLRELLLWNPCIGKGLMLPDSPLNGVVGYHLGFAPSSNDYKVLALDYCNEAAIYSLTDNCWKLISDRSNAKDFSLSRGALCCGGALYSMDYKAEKLYSFDFDAEQFSVVQLPDRVKESTVRFMLCIGDSPAIFTMSSEKCLIWVMNKDKDGGENPNPNPNPWRLWHSGETSSYICNLLKKSILGNVYLHNSDSPTLIMSFHQWKNTFSVKTRAKLMSYNIASQEVEHLGESIHDLISFSTHVESLVLHKGFEEQRLISLPLIKY